MRHAIRLLTAAFSKRVFHMEPRMYIHMEPRMYIRGFFPTVFTFLVAAGFGSSRSATAVTYYFSPDGHDTADGKSPEHAWKSLGQVWGAKLKAGDEVLLQRGGVWHEDLTIPADGEAGHPIVISAYGKGDRPCIDGADPIKGSKFEPTGIADVFVVSIDHKPAGVFAGRNASLDEANAQADLNSRAGTFWWDAGKLYVHPDHPQSPESMALEIPVREFCVEVSRSNVALRSLSIRHAGRTDRGALTVWADHPLKGIELSDCDISCNCGRGAWSCGPEGQSIQDVLIKANTFQDNAGSGLSIILGDRGEVSGNTFNRNCRRALEPWQAGIRLWSAGVRNLKIADNTISDQRWMHDHDSAIGIHCDETGGHIVIAGNKIKHLDHAGIEVENTRGVLLEKNTIEDCNIGIFINRAGHDHIIRGNTIKDSRSQGLAIQGWLAHGVDAQPEITVEGRLLTRNLFENNLSTGSRYGNLKATNGGEQIDPPLGNIFRNNQLGPERKGFIEWGTTTLDTYSRWPAMPATAQERH